MDLTSPSRSSLKRACDNCRRRKVKCSRGMPCDKCQRLLLSCSYRDILCRNRLKFRTLYPLDPVAPPSAQNDPPQAQFYADKESFPNPPAFERSSETPSIFLITDTQHSPHDISSTLSRLRSASTSSSVEAANGRGQSRSHVCRLSPQILLAHVNVYLKYLFPIMPVMRREQLYLDSQQPELLSPQRYTFLASLCVAAHFQLKLDRDALVPDAARRQNLGNSHLQISAEKLLSEAVRARQKCDIAEDISTEALLTSFFLFVSYRNLNKQRHAWYYLRQATSMAFTLGLHRESTYAELNEEEAEERRRVFWLLFITERQECQTPD
ncbi:hypothetical protein PENSUB_3339 [Penicillium subrubescens]|uniref:Zn(2)-C6 fungal-type domain-containing protein n=1 Tax=Penicillium subrubescens TaxID=1316194 RepID=A0A1Q5UFA2_9EURO|nr:hypothetical protein PENSUB_3339 [Penicillium subrubescens]